METPSPTWLPHPAVLRVAAYAVCIIVVGIASGMVLELLSQLSIVLVPVLVAIYLTRILAVPGNWLTAHGWRPAPAAGAVLLGFLLLVAGLVWICHAYRYTDLPYLNWITLGFTAFAGCSMVVNTRFWSFKELHIRRKVPFVALLLVVLAILLIVSEPPLVLFGFFVLYSLSGYVMAALRYLRPGPSPTQTP